MSPSFRARIRRRRASAPLLASLALAACAPAGSAPVGSAPAIPPTPDDGTSAAAAIVVENRFETCGARFDLPADWTPRPAAGGRWLLAGSDEGSGFRVAVRCVDASPATGTHELPEVAAELREVEGRDVMLEYVAVLDATASRPGMIALRQSGADDGVVSEVARWHDELGNAPGSGRQPYPDGLLSIRWNSGDPTQVAQRDAFLATLAASFTLPPAQDDQGLAP
ncbi:hypothetical protein [Coralloluteibacterium stylophorae]|uniref:Uncharacterized protein n=1 Tax=Coralloluteibacterium stylophorae TaxID=1776034 RepID=A0A8J7VV07_9GAMM|nr:hypothetical protein [Coralloluteibacterium stylophorae]MBS7455701.1 hypothetical protein [Coralloluteibacterium stylophorae]